MLFQDTYAYLLPLIWMFVVCNCVVSLGDNSLSICITIDTDLILIENILNKMFSRKTKIRKQTPDFGIPRSVGGGCNIMLDLSYNCKHVKGNLEHTSSLYIQYIHTHTNSIAI